MRDAVSATHDGRPGDTGAGRAGVGALALLVAIGLVGCNGGIHWQGPTFADGQALARRSNKLTFVYFRSWYLVECTDFEEKILKDPEVLAETRGLVCVVLDFDWDRPLAQQWHLKTVPAFAMVAPSGELLGAQCAPITREELLRVIRSAKEKLGSHTQPAAPPSKNPP
jgi:hypothetical protein